MQPDSAAASAATKNLDVTLGQIIEAMRALPKEGIYIAVSIGIILFIVGYFGGTKHNKKQILYSIFIVTLVSIFSLPIPAAALFYLAQFINPIFALLIVYVLWSAIMLGMVLSLYETWIVTIKEQFGTGR